MDTDDLSRETYNGILIEAGKLTDDLTLHYGLLSHDCKIESEYIDKAEKLTNEIMEFDDINLDDFFFGNPPDNEKLNNTLKNILTNIEKIRAIPIEKRKFDF